MAHRWIAVLLGALLALGLCPAASAREREGRVVRVAYPVQWGLTDVDEKGDYCGYTYEYLQEIAQYTGWSYEFVRAEGTINEQLTALIDMLEKGEVDLMGSMTYTEQAAQQFDYSGSSYGTVYTTLEVLMENTSVNERNYQLKTPLRVAVLENARNSIAELEEYCASNAVSLSLVACSDDTQQLAALRDGRADALLSRDTIRNEYTRTVARFSPKPFYFATTKGSFDLLSELNSAMILISDADPYFSATLYEKYMGRQAFALSYNDTERAYLDSAPTLRVGLALEREPLEGRGEDGLPRGISPDVLGYILNKTGLRCEYVWTDSMEELLKKIDQKEVDLALGVEYDYELAGRYSFSLTRPYVSSQILMAAHREVNPYDLEGKRLAVIRGLNFEGEFMGKAKWYDSIAECMRAVDSGEADYTYVNGYAAQYNCSLYQYRNVSLIPLSSYTHQFCIAVAHGSGSSLLTIINKTLRGMTDSELQVIIYNNTIPQANGMTLGMFIEANPEASVCFLAGVMALALGFLIWFAEAQRRSRRRTEIEVHRYRMLADLSGEYLFEYDFGADRLTLAQRTADLFGQARVREHFHRNLERSNETKEHQIRIRREHQELMERDQCTWETQARVIDGRLRWVRTYATIVRDNHGNPIYCLGKVSDIQEEREERERLSHRAETDGLTELYNIAAARGMICARLAAKGAEDVSAFIIMDVDRFKGVNDRYGHFTGDEVLRRIAATLRSAFRREDVCGRLGGDEFVVFMENAADEAVVGEKCAALCRTVEQELREYGVTLSVGAALVRGAADYDAAYQAADRALYSVKNHGRNGCETARMEQDETPCPPAEE